jgi:spore coat protein A
MKRTVIGDYDGDGKTDLAVWRQREGRLYVIESSTGADRAQDYGFGTYLVPGDYDGDGKTDFAWWTGDDWHVIDSLTGIERVEPLGTAGDIPVPGDYDGDGKTDLAVWRPREGYWYISESSTGFF